LGFEQCSKIINIIVLSRHAVGKSKARGVKYQIFEIDVKTMIDEKRRNTAFYHLTALVQ
jgi:hypothetical protein